MQRNASKSFHLFSFRYVHIALSNVSLGCSCVCLHFISICLCYRCKTALNCSSTVLQWLNTILNWLCVYGMMSVFFYPWSTFLCVSKQCLLKDVRKVQVIVRGKKGRERRGRKERKEKKKYRAKGGEKEKVYLVRGLKCPKNNPNKPQVTLGDKSLMKPIWNIVLKVI